METGFADELRGYSKSLLKTEIMTTSKVPDTIFELSSNPAHLDPLATFERWREDAKEKIGFFATAMSLATVSEEGAPNARMVLLQAVSAGGLVFFTNLDSAKGKHLKTNNKAAACFHWPSCGQQVRVQGRLRTYPTAMQTTISRAAHEALKSVRMLQRSHQSYLTVPRSWSVSESSRSDLEAAQSLTLNIGPACI